MAALDRIDEFEGIRGILSVIVVVGHLGLYYGHDWMPWFWGTMEIFFVLSGYLITRLLLGRVDEDRTVRRYFVRRMLRIWPVYYVVLAFACGLDFLLSRAAGQTNPLGYGVLKSAFFVQNVEHYLGTAGAKLRVGYPEHFNQSWSVALEEQFYILLPALLWGLGKIGFDLRRPRQWLWIMIGGGLLCICTAMRLNGVSVGIFAGRADGFVLGVLLAIHQGARVTRAATGPSKMFDVFLSIAAVAVIGVASAYYVTGTAGFDDSLESRRIMAFGIPAFALFGLALVKVCVNGAGDKRLSPLRAGLLQHLGRISYSTYLWHIPLLIVLGGIFSQNSSLPLPEIVKIPLMLGLILILSHFSYRLIEQPALRLKHYFRYQES